MDIIKQAESEGVHIRPLVKKHYRKFLSYMQTYGADTVKKCLETGRDGKVKLTFFTNKKDRYQMMQLLDLIR